MTTKALNISLLLHGTRAETFRRARPARRQHARGGRRAGRPFKSGNQTGDESASSRFPGERNTAAPASKVKGVPYESENFIQEGASNSAHGLCWAPVPALGSSCPSLFR